MILLNIRNRGIIMITFYRLWDYCNRKDINKTELKLGAGLANTTVAKLNNNQIVTTETINKICTFLKVQPHQIMEWEEDH